MRIVGVDPSYEKTGIATTTDTRTLRPPTAMADDYPLRRATRRRAWLRGQLRPLVRGADVVAIEGMYSSLQYGVLDRAELLGAFVDLVWDATDAAILIVAPKSAKMLATGNGGPATDKAAMLEAARAAGSPATNGDEADAWWIAQIALRVTVPLAAYPTAGELPPHRLRALDPYRPPWTDKHPDPWIRHP